MSSSLTGICARLDHYGYLVVAIGGVVALFSVFVLPYADFIIVSVTGVGAAGMGEFELWLIPLAALILIGVPAWRWRTLTPSPATERTASVAVLTAGGVATAALVGGLVNVGEAMGMLGAGLWLPLSSNIAAGVGGWREYRRAAQSVSTGEIAV